MESTLSGVAQSFFLPSFRSVVEEVRATSTGSSRTVARRQRMVMKQTTVTTMDRSDGFW